MYKKTITKGYRNIYMDEGRSLRGPAWGGLEECKASRTPANDYIGIEEQVTTFIPDPGPLEVGQDYCTDAGLQVTVLSADVAGEYPVLVRSSFSGSLYLCNEDGQSAPSDGFEFTILREGFNCDE